MTWSYDVGFDMKPNENIDLTFTWYHSEFEDFLGMSREKKGSNIFWHNQEWVKLWSAWLDYYQAMGEFRNSTQFKQLSKELDDS